MSDISPMEIYKLLPQTNCRKCGQPSCMAFAVKMANKKAFVDECTELNQAKYIRNKMNLKELASKLLNAGETNLVVHEDRCNGCGDCVIACPPNMSVSLDASGGKGPTNEEVTMKVKNGRVVVTNLKLCRRFSDEEGSGSKPCNVCVESCPQKAIEFM